MSNFWFREDKMKCRSKKILLFTLSHSKGFSLPEVVAALMILALISSSVLVVMNRCMASAADSALRMQAFEVAHENMETLLSKDSVSEMVEYGSSDKYPEIQWQTTVEMFYEPITARAWIQGICSAEYTDTSGDVQTVELMHWLTDVTKQQLLEIIRQKQKQQQERLAFLVVGTIEEAAEYAGVDVETVEEWVDNGMLKTEDGSFVKDNLDLYKDTGGDPPPEAKNQQVKSKAELVELAKERPEPVEQKEQSKPDEQEMDEWEKWRNEIEPVTGLTYGELAEMTFDEIWALLDKLGY